MNRELTFFGRPDIHEFQELTRDELLVEIPEDHFVNFKIDVVGLASHVAGGPIPNDNFNTLTCHRIPGNTGTRYRDLHVERKSALRWLETAAAKYKGRRKSPPRTPNAPNDQPAPITKEPQRDVWLLDAVYYIGFGTWAPIEWDDLQGQTNRLGGVPEDIRQRALDGDLPIWGREGFAGPLDLLPKKYWKYYGFDWFSLLGDEPEEFQTEIKENVSTISIGVCRSLKTSKSKVEELWPVENT